MKWNNCVLIWDGKRQTDSFDAKTMYSQLKAYQAEYGSDNRVWYDLLRKKCFGHGYIQKRIPEEFSFFSDEGKFLTHERWGKRYVNSYFVPVYGPKYIKSKEIIYQDSPLLTKYKDKSLLIVGAGPSTVKVDWAKVSADYIWSCNHFFLYPKIADKLVSLFMISNEVKINADKKLEAYMRKFPASTALFETTSRAQKQVAEFNERLPGRSTYMHARYRSKLGSMPRLICLAVSLGVSKVYFVGMDGLPTKNTPHAFEPGKRLKGAPTKEGAPDIFRRQYVIFWDYILNVMNPKTEFYNLGEGVEGNLTTDISREMFPLSRMEQE